MGQRADKAFFVFRRLPIVIGYPAEMAARAAAETLIAMHLVHTIRPWHRRFEKAFNR